MTQFLIFLLVLSGLIFLHEMGHFLVSRLVGIEIEEFGFGIPPRALGVWRGAGYLMLGKQRIEIPRNFEHGFDWPRILDSEITVTVNQEDEKYYLCSLEAIETREVAVSKNKYNVMVDENGKPVEDKNETREVAIKLGKEPGLTKMEGTLKEAHPGTLVSINWLPLGGFVRARGEADPTVPGGLMASNPWKRLGVYFAGPLMNLLTAVVIFGMVISQYGIQVPPILILNVVSASPAETAGLMDQDTILEINGEKIENSGQASVLIQENLDHPIDLLIERDGEQLLITATPRSDRDPEDGALGVLLGSETRPATIPEMATGGFIMTAGYAQALITLPVAITRGVIQPEEARLSGFKGIYDLIGSAVERDAETRQQAAAPTSGDEMPVQPTNWTLIVIAILSTSLGTLNLLPIPALDGGRILFTLPEIFIRRRIPTRFENAVNTVVFLLLIAVMLFVNLMDFIDPVEMTLP